MPTNQKTKKVPVHKFISLRHFANTSWENLPLQTKLLALQSVNVLNANKALSEYYKQFE
jgi:hypothetical protein